MSRQSGSCCHHPNSDFNLKKKKTCRRRTLLLKRKVLSTVSLPVTSFFFKTYRSLVCFFPSLYLPEQPTPAVDTMCVYIFFYWWMTWTCLSVTNVGNQPIITLQSFNNVLPKPSVLFSLRTSRLTRPNPLTPSHTLPPPHPPPSPPKPQSEYVSTLCWTGCPSTTTTNTTIRDSTDTHALMVLAASRWDSEK